MEAKINGQPIGLKSFKMEYSKDDEQIISDISHLKDYSIKFTLNLSENHSKLLKEFLDDQSLCEEYQKQQGAIEKLFECDGYLSLFDTETDLYVGKVRNMCEYMAQSKFYNFIPYNKYGQIVDLYTLKPIDLEKIE